MATTSSLPDYTHCLSFDGFEKVQTLAENPTKVILRTLKYHLEEYLKIELTDDVFIEIVRTVPLLYPARPLGPFSVLGFIKPIENILKRYGYSEIHPTAILGYFLYRHSTERYYRKFLLHVPHSSRAFPAGSGYSFDSLNEEERLLIDYYTDELFVPGQESTAIRSAVFPYCRLYCDVERLVNDPLEKKGLGISYESWIKKGLYREQRRFSYITDAFKLYAEFHAKVAAEIVDLDHTVLSGFVHECADRVLLIDCHSFSSRPTMLCPAPPDIDICIGYNTDSTKPDDVALGSIIHHFRTCGYKVGVNEPFSNSKTFDVPVKYHSVMIEVNKRLYMDEDTLEKIAGFDKLKRDIQAVYEILKPREVTRRNSVPTSGICAK